MNPGLPDHLQILYYDEIMFRLLTLALVHEIKNDNLKINIDGAKYKDFQDKRQKELTVIFRVLVLVVENEPINPSSIPG